MSSSPNSSSAASAASWVTKTLLGISALALVAGVFFPKTSGGGGLPANTDGMGAQGGKSSAAVAKLFKQAGIGSRLVKVDVIGPISMEADQQGSLFGGESNAMAARKALETALEDDTVKGVLVRIDTPGGTVGMSQELNSAIKRLIAKGKPVVASLGDLAASGGYYTACATDAIVANPGTLTGSIGVIMSTLNMKGLFVDKLGLKPVTIKSGKFKDLLSPYRDTSAAEVDLLQRMINTSYQQFLKAVLDGRLAHVKDPATRASLTQRITAVADGRVLVATEAVQAGLVDAIGDETDAKAKLVELVRVKHPEVSEDIELEDADENENKLMQLFGLSSANLRLPQMQTPVWAQASFAAQHPNQPLWMYE
jgi:protease IV